MSCHATQAFLLFSVVSRACSYQYPNGTRFCSAWSESKKPARRDEAKHCVQSYAVEGLATLPGADGTRPSLLLESREKACTDCSVGCGAMVLVCRLAHTGEDILVLLY